MNLRQKFIWNVVLVISVIVLAWNSYFQFYQHNDVQGAYKKFKNEEVGTDKELQNMIVDLEKNLQELGSLLNDNKKNIPNSIIIEYNVIDRHLFA